jgi:hypothetical protein
MSAFLFAFAWCNFVYLLKIVAEVAAKFRDMAIIIQKGLKFKTV